MKTAEVFLLFTRLQRQRFKSENILAWITSAAVGFPLAEFSEVVIYAAYPPCFFPTALTKFAGGMRKKKLVFFPHVGVRKVFAAAVKVQYLFSQEFRGGALTYADTVIFDPGIFKGLFPAVKPLQGCHIEGFV